VSLFVQQESGAARNESFQPGLIGALDFGDSLPGLQCVQSRGVAEQSQVRVGLPGRRVIEPQLACDSEARCQRLETRTIINGDSNSAAGFAHEPAGVRCELDGVECHAGQFQRGQAMCELLAVNPRRSEHFKRCGRAATDRKIRRLEQSDAGVQQRFGKTAHIRRRVDPGQARVIEELRALPAMHLYDLQIEVELEFGLQHQCDFANGHAMANGDSVKADEGLQTIVQHRTGDVDAINRIGSIENDEANAVVGRCDHGIAHGRYVGIETRTDVLDIEHDGVNILQHFGRRPANLAVKTDHLNSRARVLAIADDLNVELAGKAVLRAEESHDLKILCVVQQANATSPVAGDAGVVCEQPDSRAGQLPEFVAFQNVDSRQDSSRVGLRQNREQQQQNSNQSGFHQTDTIEQPLWK
jgi:hypothetical protein